MRKYVVRELRFLSKNLFFEENTSLIYSIITTRSSIEIDVILVNVVTINVQVKIVMTIFIKYD